MKAHYQLSRTSFTAIFLFALFFVTSCKKSANTMPVPDAGYGCSTTTVLSSVTNLSAKLVYLNLPVPKWYFSLDLPGSIYITADNCDHAAEIQAIIAGHATTELLNVTVSGKIKRRTEGQDTLSNKLSYRPTYLIAIDNMH
jgi:hypothetical protein